MRAKAKIIDQVHDGLEGVSVHYVMAHGDADHQTFWVMVRDLAEGRRFAAAYFNHETREEGRDQTQGTMANLRRYAASSCVVVPLAKKPRQVSK